MLSITFKYAYAARVQETLTTLMTTNTYRPVVVEMSKLVGEALDVVWFEVTAVVDNVVVGRRNCSLSDRLAHQKEIIPDGIELDYGSSCAIGVRFTTRIWSHGHRQLCQEEGSSCRDHSSRTASY